MIFKTDFEALFDSLLCSLSAKLVQVTSLAALALSWWNNFYMGEKERKRERRVGVVSILYPSLAIRVIYQNISWGDKETVPFSNLQYTVRQCSMPEENTAFAELAGGPSRTHCPIRRSIDRW